MNVIVDPRVSNRFEGRESVLNALSASLIRKIVKEFTLNKLTEAK